MTLLRRTMELALLAVILANVAVAAGLAATGDRPRAAVCCAAVFLMSIALAYSRSPQAPR